jgi:hypothetical protein
MTVPICLLLSNPPVIPSLFVPPLGELQAARQSLYDLPDLSQNIMRLQDLAALAVAPLRRMLEMVEVILAIKNCLQAVLDSLLPPSPGPLLECFKGLIQAIARLASYFPPFTYVKTALSIMAFAIAVIDEVVALFVQLDIRITEYKEVATAAVSLGDLELATMADCATGETTPLIINAMDLLITITPLISLMLEPLVRLIPDPTLREEFKKLANLPETLTTIKEGIEQVGGVPGLETLLDVLWTARNVIVQMYKILAPVVGADAGGLSVMTRPTLVNL